MHIHGYSKYESYTSHKEFAIRPVSLLFDLNQAIIIQALIYSINRVKTICLQFTK